MSEEFPDVVGGGTGSNLDLQDLLRSLLNCYCFESIESDKVVGKNHMSGRCIYLHFNSIEFYSILPLTCSSCMCES